MNLYVKVCIMSFILGMCCSIEAAAFTQDEVDIWSFKDNGLDVIIETKIYSCISKFILTKKSLDKNQHEVLDTIAKASVEHAANGCK